VLGLTRRQPVVSEWLLQRLRDDVEIAAYHCPTEYRFNAIGAVSVGA